MISNITACVVQVRTILSQNTTDDTSARAFAGLKAGKHEIKVWPKELSL